MVGSWQKGTQIGSSACCVMLYVRHRACTVDLRGGRHRQEVRPFRHSSKTSLVPSPQAAQAALSQHEPVDMGGPAWAGMGICQNRGQLDPPFSNLPPGLTCAAVSQDGHSIKVSKHIRTYLGTAYFREPVRHPKTRVHNMLP